MSRPLAASPKKRAAKKPPTLAPGTHGVDLDAQPIGPKEIVDGVLASLAAGLEVEELSALIQGLAFAHGCCATRIAIIPCPDEEFDRLAAISKALWADGANQMADALVRDINKKRGAA